MPEAAVAPSQAQAPRTDRRDPWWVGPLFTAIGLLSFVVYATFRAIHGHATSTYVDGHVVTSTYLFDWPGWGELLSPFFSPLLILPFLPAWVSPAFLILWAPGGFRVTCYYYRKAYYRSLFSHPRA